MAAELEGWLADNYRELVAEGNATWPEVAARFAAASDNDAAAWAAAQGRAEADTTEAPKGRRSAADATTEKG